MPFLNMFKGIAYHCKRQNQSNLMTQSYRDSSSQPVARETNTPLGILREKTINCFTGLINVFQYCYLCECQCTGF